MSEKRPPPGSPTYCETSSEEPPQDGAPGSPTYREPEAKRARTSGDNSDETPAAMPAAEPASTSDTSTSLASSSSSSSSSPPPSSPSQPKSFLNSLLETQARHIEHLQVAPASSSVAQPVQDSVETLRQVREDIERRLTEWVSACEFDPSREDHVSQEIELRLGSITGQSSFSTGVHTHQKFSAGLSKMDFERIQERLITHPDFDGKDASSVEYVYDVNGSQNIRISVNPKTKEVLKAQSKDKLRHFDLPSPKRWDFHYVLRIAEARETEYECPGEISAGWSQIRTKNRTNFVHRDYAQWSIDLTAVTTEEYFTQIGSETPLARTTERYELEFELAPGSAKLQRWQDQKFISQLVTELYWLLLSVLHPFGYDKLKSAPDLSKQDKFADLQMAQVMNHQELQGLQQALWAQVPNQQYGRSSSNFPGAMPVAFSRRFFPLVQNPEHKYYVSEKTDGIRYLLFVHAGRSFFVNRKNDFFEVTARFPQLSTVLWPNGALIDGELTRNLSNAKPFFMIFDILSVHGQPLNGALLEKRLEVIRDQVVLPYRQAMANNQIPDHEHAFVLIAKLFFTRDKIRNIFAAITRNEHGERVYRDGEGKRHHLTDGIILTPNDIYRPFGNQNLFKWKYPDLLSIDFVVREPEKASHNSLISIYCGGNGSELIFCRDAAFIPTQTEQLRERIRIARDDANRRGLTSHHPSRNVVAECVYSTDQGCWQFHLIREDKHHPNHISVVMDTMEAVAENMTEQEVVYRLSRPQSHDDWLAKSRAILAQAFRM